jgi:hypothetical protein
MTPPLSLTDPARADNTGGVPLGIAGRAVSASPLSVLAGALEEAGPDGTMTARPLGPAPSSSGSRSRSGVGPMPLFEEAVASLSSLTMPVAPSACSAPTSVEREPWAAIEPTIPSHNARNAGECEPTWWFATWPATSTRKARGSGGREPVLPEQYPCPGGEGLLVESRPRTSGIAFARLWGVSPRGCTSMGMSKS